MSSVTQICNLALQKVGTRSTIADLTEDSNEARNCNLVYETTRDEVLGMAFWNCARNTLTLSVLKSVPGTPTNPSAPSSPVWIPDWPPPPWMFEYAYPTDCIQMRYLVPQPAVGWAGSVPIFGTAVTTFPQYEGMPVRFAVANDQISGSDTTVILTNQYQAIGVYTKRLTNPNLFSAQFIEALSSAIGAKITMALTGDKALRKELFTSANDAILQARVTDGNEGLTVQESTPDWLQARESFSYFGYNWAGFVAPFNPLYVT